MSGDLGAMTVRLALDNAPFREALSNLNKELKLSQAELKNSLSGVDKLGDGSDGLKSKITALTTQINIQQQVVDLHKNRLDKNKEALEKTAEKHEELRKKVEASKNAYELSAKELGKNSDETKKLKDEHDKLSKEYKSNEELLLRKNKAVQQSTLDYTNASTKLNVLNSEMKNTSEELEKQTNKWNQLSEASRKTSEKLATIGKDFQKVGKNLTTHITAPIVALGGLSAKSAIDFESAFAGVRKTVDATEEEFSRLKDGIRKMALELPASANEIANVAESAGQLGIKTPNILEFSKVMIDLGESTNLSATQASDSLSRFANITNMSQNDFDRLGSTLVELGNNFATTEAEIVEMSMRLAGAGAQVGLTEAEILGFATALSSVGIEAEMGGNAFSKTIIKMQLASELGGVALHDFSRIAGLTSDAFADMFKSNPSEAIEAFIVGLSKMDEQGISAIATLDEMGFREVRLRDTLLRATNAQELFSSAVEMGSKAWEENTALAKEAEQRYATTAGQIKIMRNNLNEISMQLGEALLPHINKFIEKVKDLSTNFHGLSSETQNNIIKFGLLLGAIGPTISIIGKTISVAGQLSKAVSVVSKVMAVSSGSVGGLTKAFALFTNPVGLAVLALGGLTIGGIALYNHFKQELIPEVEHFGEGVSEATKKATEGFLNMNEEITRDLLTLSISGQEITEEMKDGINSNISQMASETKTAICNAKEDAVESLRSLLANTVEISEEEKEAIINSTQDAYDGKIEKISDAENTIAEIMETARENNGILTEEALSLMGQSQQLIVEEGIKHLSQSELDQKIILERMKENASIISAQQSAEVVKNSVNQKEKVIAEAEEQYEKSLGEIIRLRDEAGTISEETANKLIAEAQRQRDESIKSAKEMHKDIVAEAQTQAGEHINSINWETGEVLKRWDKFKKDVAILWDGIKEKRLRVLDGMEKDNKDKLENIREKNREIFDNIKTYFEELSEKSLNWGKNMIDGFINGIKSGSQALQNAVSSVTSGVKQYLGFNSPAEKGEGRNIVKWGYNMISGFVDGINSAEGLLTSNAESLMSNLSMSKVFSDLSIDKEIQINSGSLDDAINSITPNMSTSTSTSTNTVNFEGMFKGANLTVRNDQDIVKIAKKVIEFMEENTNMNSRQVGS